MLAQIEVVKLLMKTKTVFLALTLEIFEIDNNERK